MRPLHAILAAFGVLVAVYFIGAGLLPSEWEEQDRAEICADPELLFDALSDPDEVAAWSSLTREEDEPEIQSTPGAGGQVEWPTDGEDGRIAILEVVPEGTDRVDYRLEVDGRTMATATARVDEREGQHNLVHLRIEPQVETGAGRWVGLISRLQGDVRRLASSELESVSERVNGEC